MLPQPVFSQQRPCTTSKAQAAAAPRKSVRGWKKKNNNVLEVVLQRGDLGLLLAELAPNPDQLVQIATGAATARNVVQVAGRVAIGGTVAAAAAIAASTGTAAAAARIPDAEGVAMEVLAGVEAALQARVELCVVIVCAAVG
jgi:hypothetical protein